MASSILNEPPPYTSTNDDALPAYEGAAVSTLFPAQFAVYQKTGFLHPTTAILAIDESTPLYHITLGSGLLDESLPDVVLHTSATENGCALAHSKVLSSNAHGHRIQLLSEIDPPIYEELKLESGRGSRKYTFSVDGNGTHKKGAGRQMFEWRPSRGKDVQSLGLRYYGWKLIWIRNPNSGAADYAEQEEVVAVWSKCSDGKSRKVLGFGFLGSGVSGAFGNVWEVMAVMTGLAIWHAEAVDR